MKENYSETKKITEVTESDDYYSISCSGTCCGLKKEYGAIPKKGDELTVHTIGSAFGAIRGMDLNGVKVFWKTDEDIESERQQWLKDNEEKKQKRFEEEKGSMDKQYEALPPVFKERIDRFRKNNDRFRIDYESYELFCCEQALVIAESLKTPEAISEFRKKDWKDQLKQVPGLSDDHSGNTFGAACVLAQLYLQAGKRF